MKGQYWNASLETLDKDKLKEWQLRLLKEQVKYVYNNSSFYRHRFDEAGVKPEDIQTFLDFQKKIPIFRKDDIRAEIRRTGDPFGGLLCCPRSRLKNIWISRGTSGENTFGALTASDLEIMAELLSRSLWMIGVRPGMRVFLTNVNWHYVTSLIISVYQRIRAFPICFDMSHPSTLPRVASHIRWLKPEVFLTSHMMLTGLPEEIRKQGFNPREVLSSVKIVVNMAETLTPGQRRWCYEQWGGETSIFDLGGTGESYALFVECPEKEGGHYWEDLAYIECIDPMTNEVVELGEPGEEVVTNLQAKGLVFLRYGVEDMIRMTEKPCRCGRTHGRATILGRTIWLIDIKGKKIMPIDLQRIFEEFPETAQAAFTILKKAESMKKLEIRASFDKNITSNPSQLKSQIEERILAKMGIKSEIEWIPYEQLPKQFAKIMRITDLK